MKVAGFKVDVTPETGFPLSYAINERVDSPIYIRGCVVDDGGTRIVLASCDYLYILGESYTGMRRLLAESACISEENVFLHCVHQHDSVTLATGLNAIYREYSGHDCCPEAYYEKVCARLGDAVRRAVSGGFAEIADLAVSESRLKGLASNRRLLRDGKLWSTRWAMTSDPELQKEPVGLIDPLLRTLVFLDNKGRRTVALHFYATHPQAAYHRRMVGSDVPGVALDHVERRQKDGCLQIYLTGCGGNITFGKYTSAVKEESLKVLGTRLGKAIAGNLRNARKVKPGGLAVKRSIFEIPLNPMFTEEYLLAGLEKSRGQYGNLMHASLMEVFRAWDKWKNAEVRRISLSDSVHILSLPAEVVVEYQLYAQSLVPEQFLACAAYENCTYDYLPTAEMYEEGGYESSSDGTFCTSEIDARLKSSIRELLQDLM